MQYEGVATEHRAVRTDCGVFDVSHMGELHVEGPSAETMLQGLLSNDLAKVEIGQRAVHAADERDRRDHRRPDRLPARPVRVPARRQRVEPRAGLLVAEGARDTGLGGARRLGRVRDARRPGAACPRAARPRGGAVVHVRDGGARRRRVPCRADRLHRRAGCRADLSREDAVALWDAVVARGAVPCGLGARDTLRLEMCYPLHGNDITPETDAISAGLGWACALDKDFSGAGELRRIKADGPERKLVPFVMEDKAVPRQGMPVEGGGEVTSGTHSPMLDRGIGMAYVPAGQAAPDTELVVDVRGRPRRGRIVTKPIYRRRLTRGSRRELPRRPALPPRARLGARRGRRGGARHHLVRAGLARRARPLRGARGRSERDEGPVVRRGRVGQGRLGHRSRRSRARCSRSTRQSSTRRRRSTTTRTARAG